MSTLTIDELRALEAASAERLTALEQQIDLSQTADIRAFCAAFSTLRGRPLYLVPQDMPPDPAAVWVAVGECDYIFYEQRATPPYQEHIILHEVSHMVCRHAEPKMDSDYLRQTLLPHLDPDLIRAMLGRIGYDTRTECEAEYLATLIEQRWRHARRHDRGEPIQDHRGTLASAEAGRVRHNLTDYATKLRAR